MIKNIALTIVIFLLFPLIVSAQQSIPIDYSAADSVALNTKYNGDVVALTTALTKPFKDQFLKARAIFRWITDNIAYDNKYYNKYGYEGKEQKTFKCKGDSATCDLKRQVWELEYIDHILDQHKGVCQGYAMIFKKMCNLAGIDCEVVPGYTRTEYYEIGTMGNLDHAWNVVRLNSEYYLVDATWAAGGCAKDDDGRLLAFNKHFNDYYWLTPPEAFVRNHFPEDAKWTLIKNYKKENFSANPFYEGGLISYIQLLAPSTGIIHVKHGDTVHFKIAFGGNIKTLQINTNIFQNPDIYYDEYVSRHKSVKVLDTFAIKKQRYVDFKKNGDVYEFNYVVKDYSLDYMDIMFDRKRVMRFKATYR